MHHLTMSGPIWQTLIPGDLVRRKRKRRTGEVVAVLESTHEGMSTAVQVCWDERCWDWSQEATDCLDLVKPAAVVAPRRSLEDATGLLDGVMTDCQRRQILLQIAEGRLRWKAPRGAMTVDLLKRIKALEPELIVHLGAQQDEGQP